ncbi:DHA2 family efflux MFS transporter permease subunit [Marinicrinis lubricantis]|uniref:DHA2 family efflux MFS transporter permease subunit n=1 Tax=Marinicrinis lubricantis TaxID=2086470 RepID=A0ABW1IUH4_9BACL
MAKTEIQPQEQPINKVLIMSTLIIGAFVTLLSQTLINIALPQMMESLDVSANTAQWLTTGFMLVNGVLIPISAFLIDKFSTRQLVNTSTILFAIGTLFCMLAPNFTVLLIGRLIQACGAGILMPLMTVVTLTIFPIEKRGQAMGVMGLAMVFAPAVGPTLSGWIVENYSWRVLFYIILPFALLAVVMGLLFMKNVTQRSAHRLDLTSIILSTLGFGGLLYGFSDAGNDGWGSSTVIISLTVGVIGLLLFLFRELRSEKPLLEFRVFKYGMFSLTTVINVIITMAMYAGMILLPLYVQTLRGFSAVESGLLLLPGAIIMGIMSPITGIIFDRVGARWLAVVGLIITIITTWEFSRLTDSTSYTHLILMYTARMFGMSMLMMPIMTAGLNQLPQRLNAHGTAMVNTLRTISGALGTALLVTIATNLQKSRMTEIVTSQGIAQDDKALMTGAYTDSFIYGINAAFQVATWITVAALVLAFFIKRTTPQKEETPKQNSEKNTIQEAAEN